MEIVLKVLEAVLITILSYQVGKMAGIRQSAELLKEEED